MTISIKINEYMKCKIERFNQSIEL